MIIHDEDCTPTVAQMSETGVVLLHHDALCEFGGAASSIPATRLAMPASEQYAPTEQVSQIVAAFLDSRYAAKGGKVEFLQRDDD